GGPRRGRRLWRDPAAVLDTAVDVARPLHLHFQFEVRGFPLPHQIHSAGRLLAGRLDRDRAVFHLPVLVAGPAVECLAVEQRRPALMFLEIDWLRLREATATTPTLAERAWWASRWRAASHRRLLCCHEAYPAFDGG